MSLPRFVLVTPVRNEARFIGHTIDAIAAQTLPPDRWVIVSDGSTDATDEIIQRRAAELPFLRYSRRDAPPTRDFRSKVLAIRQGLREFDDFPYDFIGNLDGDVVPPPDYFQKLFDHFESDPTLGIAGGEIYETARISSRTQLVNAGHSVAGAVQMFRRKCWEDIGGYPLLPLGGEDAAAEFMARMHGWKTHTVRSLRVLHQRTTGTEGRSPLRSFYDMGRREAVLGYHPIFELLRCTNRALARPMVLGGLAQLAGFTAAKIRREPLGPPADCVAFLRREQLARIRALVTGKRI